MAFGVDASRVEATTVTVNAATGNQSEREWRAVERESGDDLHETEDGDWNQIAREEMLEWSESTNNGGVKHKHGVHRCREEAILVVEALTLCIYIG